VLAAPGLDPQHLRRGLTILAVAVLTPMIVTLVRRTVGTIPASALPIVATAIGILLPAAGQAFDVLALDETALAGGAAVGAAGTAVHEIARGRYPAPRETPTTGAGRRRGIGELPRLTPRSRGTEVSG
jgi:hypothetical protein